MLLLLALDDDDVVAAVVRTSEADLICLIRLLYAFLLPLSVFDW